MRRCRGPTTLVHLLGRILFACWSCHDVCRHVTVVYFLLSRQFVCWQCGRTSGLHVYCRVRLDERDIERLHDDNRDLCDMSRWELVRWGRGPTRSLHVYGRLLLWRWCCHDVRGRGGVVRDVYGWEVVRRGRGPTRRMHVLGWVLFACWCRDGVRRHVSVVHGLPGRQFVCEQCRSAGGVHVYCGVRLDERNVRRVYDYNGDVCDMPRW